MIPNLQSLVCNTRSLPIHCTKRKTKKTGETFFRQDQKFRPVRNRLEQQAIVDPTSLAGLTLWLTAAIFAVILLKTSLDRIINLHHWQPDRAINFECHQPAEEAPTYRAGHLPWSSAPLHRLLLHYDQSIPALRKVLPTPQRQVPLFP